MELNKIFQVVKIKQELSYSDHPYARKNCNSPTVSAEIASYEIGDRDREVFLVMILNTKLELIGLYEAHVGSINASIVSPRDVFKPVILGNGNSIIVSHNHPSGKPSPSNEDIQVTNRLVECGKILGIEVLDHIIVTNEKEKYYSMREKGYI